MYTDCALFYMYKAQHGTHLLLAHRRKANSEQSSNPRLCSYTYQLNVNYVSLILGYSVILTLSWTILVGFFLQNLFIKSVAALIFTIHIFYSQLRFCSLQLDMSRCTHLWHCTWKFLSNSPPLHQKHYNRKYHYLCYLKSYKGKYKESPN